MKQKERPNAVGFELWTERAGVAQVEAEARVQEAYRSLQKEKAAAVAKADARDVRRFLG